MVERQLAEKAIDVGETTQGHEVQGRLAARSRLQRGASGDLHPREPRLLGQLPGHRRVGLRGGAVGQEPAQGLEAPVEQEAGLAEGAHGRGGEQGDQGQEHGECYGRERPSSARRKLQTSVSSSITLASGLPAPWPAWVSDAQQDRPAPRGRRLQARRHLARVHRVDARVGLAGVSSTAG